MGGIQAELINGPDDTVAAGAIIAFDTVINQIGGAVLHNTTPGTFTITQNGYYLVNWWVAPDGGESTTGSSISLYVGGAYHSSGASQLVTGQVSGTALVSVAAVPTTLYLANGSGDAINLEDTHSQAGITILAISTAP